MSFLWEYFSKYLIRRSVSEIDDWFRLLASLLMDRSGRIKFASAVVGSDALVRADGKAAQKRKLLVDDELEAVQLLLSQTK